MTALSNLVSKLDCDKPEILNQFNMEFVRLLLKKITDKELQTVKSTINNYILEQLADDLINYKLYSYKTLDGINSEILIQPENTSIIRHYMLILTNESIQFRRLR